MTPHIIDSLHPDTLSKMSEKQDKLIRNKPSRKFEIGDKLFAKTFNGTEWIPVMFTKVTGPLSYEVQTNTGIFLRCHVDHFSRSYSDHVAEEPVEDWCMPDLFTQNLILLQFKLRYHHLHKFVQFLFIILLVYLDLLIVLHPYFKLNMEGKCDNV